MKLIFAIIILQLFYVGSQAQQGMLLIQKNKRTVKAYYTGSNIIMQHKRGYMIQGILGRIQKDSFNILNFTIKRVEMGMGFARFDTSYNGYSEFSVTEIQSIPKLKTKSIFTTLQGLSILGAVGITTASIANGLKFKENIGTIAKDIAIKGGGLFLLSKFFSLFNKKNYEFKKKYTIALMQF
jgi:hypothetical protein